MNQKKKTLIKKATTCAEHFSLSRKNERVQVSFFYKIFSFMRKIKLQKIFQWTKQTKIVHTMLICTTFNFALLQQYKIGWIPNVYVCVTKVCYCLTIFVLATFSFSTLFFCCWLFYWPLFLNNFSGKILFFMNCEWKLLHNLVLVKENS